MTQARPHSRVLGTTPLLIVSDLQRSLDFYARTLGFIDPAVHGEPPCFAMLNRDGFDLMLSLAEEAAPVRPNGPAGTWDVYVRVLDVEAEREAFAARGLSLAKGPVDTPYEMREIEIVDPDGYRWCFGQDTSGVFSSTNEVWEGVLDAGQAKFRLVLKVSLAPDGALFAVVDSLDQDATNLRVDEISRDGSAMSFEMRSIGASFRGVFSEESVLAGTWSQGGKAWPLTFRRIA